MLSGVIVAAAMAAVIERNYLGAATSVHQTYSFSQLQSLIVCLAIGIAAAFVALAFTGSLLGLRARFRRMRWMPEWSRPAVGGLVTGLLAVTALYAMNAHGITGGGYTTLGEALNGALPFRIMLVLCAMKLAATVFSYSSGGAGGIFAPALFIGAMLGGSIGNLAHKLIHTSGDPVGGFALVGMGAVFAGIIRAPMTSVLIVVEMTGSYALILPLMIANMTSYVIARRFSKMPIYEALLDQDGIHLPAHVPTDSVESMPVSTLLHERLEFVSFQESMPADELLRAWHEHRPQDVYPVLDKAQRMIGLITVDDLSLLSSEPKLVLLTNAVDLMRPPFSVHPQDSLRTALEAMVSYGVREVPVTDEEGSLLGLIDEATFAVAYMQLRSTSKRTDHVLPEPIANS